MSGDETGQLRRLLEGAVGQDPAFVCPGYGGVRFVPCPGCGGSRKVFIEEEDRIHRCGECNENGLSSFGFVDYYDRRSAALAIMTLHGRHMKNQIRKVVSIPAPTAAGGRPSAGEVIPSDLWAWRKYGQKPIKGSPYPRGYYRCSSSKGCSARKQVERSRTEPNMLVITYTSEHNHPWPTQRNALAGSTRSHHVKNSSSSSGSKSSGSED